MDSDGGSTSPGAQDYSQLSDDQLQSAIRFAELHVRSVEESHVELLRVYRDEIGAMRRQLFDRVLRRLITAAVPLSEEQRLELRETLDQGHIQANEVAAMIRAVTCGRTDRLDTLTEVEAMALLLRLKRQV